MSHEVTCSRRNAMARTLSNTHDGAATQSRSLPSPLRLPAAPTAALAAARSRAVGSVCHLRPLPPSLPPMPAELTVLPDARLRHTWHNARARTGR
mmetsp:Transcript_22572/g.55747  ORF Transcript_22572/g.55747 Transcript_22572/m.55747 type:complete len:95 (-) Transcript_22572:759-1043(-)